MIKDGDLTIVCEETSIEALLRRIEDEFVNEPLHGSDLWRPPVRTLLSVCRELDRGLERVQNIDSHPPGIVTGTDLPLKCFAGEIARSTRERAAKIFSGLKDS